MALIFVSAGSNVEPEHHLVAARGALAERYGRIGVSPVYLNAPVGFEGEDFLNLVFSFVTGDSPREVLAALGAIEDRQGRRRGEARFGPRSLDLDLLLHGDCVMDEPGLVLPRPELTGYAFMLGPLAMLAGERRHPVSGESFADLWAAFDRQGHPLQRVDVPGLEPDS